MSIWKYTYYPSVWTYLPLSFSSWSYDHSLGCRNARHFLVSPCAMSLRLLLLASAKKWTRKQKPWQGFPGGPVDKNLLATAGYSGSIPAPERSHTPRRNEACVLQPLGLCSRAHELQLPGPHAATSELPEPVLPNKRSHRSEKPEHMTNSPCLSPLTATRESPGATTKTHHSQK